MSNAEKKPQIDDVLSSIKRLVSDEVSTKNASTPLNLSENKVKNDDLSDASDLQSNPPEPVKNVDERKAALILTPALRVIDGSQSTAQTADEMRDENEDIGAETVDHQVPDTDVDSILRAISREAFPELDDNSDLNDSITSGDDRDIDEEEEAAADAQDSDIAEVDHSSDEEFDDALSASLSDEGDDIEETADALPTKDEPLILEPAQNLSELDLDSSSDETQEPAEISTDDEQQGDDGDGDDNEPGLSMSPETVEDDHDSDDNVADDDDFSDAEQAVDASTSLVDEPVADEELNLSDEESDVEETQEDGKPIINLQTDSVKSDVPPARKTGDGKNEFYENEHFQDTAAKSADSENTMDINLDAILGRASASKGQRKAPNISDLDIESMTKAAIEEEVMSHAEESIEDIASDEPEEWQDSDTAEAAQDTDPINATTDDVAIDDVAVDDVKSAEIVEDTAEFADDETDFVDEAMLRDLVGQYVRDELQGALGERITRNVRKLVRREIHRVLESREFE